MQELPAQLLCTRLIDWISVKPALGQTSFVARYDEAAKRVYPYASLGVNKFNHAPAFYRVCLLPKLHNMFTFMALQSNDTGFRLGLVPFIIFFINIYSQCCSSCKKHIHDQIETCRRVNPLLMFSKTALVQLKAPVQCFHNHLIEFAGKQVIYDKHIRTSIKWPKPNRWHFQRNFFFIFFLMFDSNSTDVCSLKSNLL